MFAVTHFQVCICRKNHEKKKKERKHLIVCVCVLNIPLFYWMTVGNNRLWNHFDSYQIIGIPNTNWSRVSLFHIRGLLKREVDP